jgi:hypothetical protein
MSGSIADHRDDYIADESGPEITASLHDGSLDGRDPDLDWCVDRSPALCAMTTADLWVAAASGELSRATRAWRIGLECWTRLDEIPELAGAFDAAEPDGERETAVTPLAIEIDVPPSLPPPLPPLFPAREPRASVAAVSQRPDVLAAVAPDRWATRAAAPAPDLFPGMFAGRLRGALVSARWIAAGCAIATASIGLSVLHAVVPPPAEAQVARASALPLATSVAHTAALMDRASRAATLRVAAPSGAESGQKRKRAGTGRALAR